MVDMALLCMLHCLAMNGIERCHALFYRQWLGSLKKSRMCHSTLSRREFSIIISRNVKLTGLLQCQKICGSLSIFVDARCSIPTIRLFHPTRSGTAIPVQASGRKGLRGLMTLSIKPVDAWRQTSH
ncbi:uncharacterized protein BDW47DRAFT_54282 [Aspergillus candidus]|uniref:Secreted protein n=1 Tax=Aspergillus candidus TaxID=41067 RepID=A0A2I2F5Y4_ASPCN|nr:hypothetical protein BDW47DRAFT_54282 [Aspergillus candidus]PLB36031.1 hypothetical protein BDW47DRAFT_54282 [Aspergillus candidus]